MSAEKVIQQQFQPFLKLKPSSCFMAVVLYKHAHISQEVSTYLSLCLLGTTFVGEKTLWIPFAANCKLKICP